MKTFGKWIGKDGDDVHVYANGERQDTICIGRNERIQKFSPDVVIFSPEGVTLQTKCQTTREPHHRALSDAEVEAGILAFLNAVRA